MKTANHHDQTSVYSTNVLDSARMGLDSMDIGMVCQSRCSQTARFRIIR